MLLALENNPLQIFRFGPRQPGQVFEELNVSGFLRSTLKTAVHYGISAYNNMVAYPNPANPACPFLVMGLEIVTPQISDRTTYSFNRNAYYLARGCDGATEVREIFDPAVYPKPPLVSVRAHILSPFASDPPGTLYAGGFDANGRAFHNTAWIYKGTPVRR